MKNLNALRESFYCNNSKNNTKGQFILGRVLMIIFLIINTYSEFKTQNSSNALNAIMVIKRYGSMEDVMQQRPSKHQFKIGGGVESYVSGNGYGTFYSPYLSVGDGKNFLTAGPVVQKRTMLLHGGKISFSRVLTGADYNGASKTEEGSKGKLQLNFFCYAQFVKQLPLSYSSVITEEVAQIKSDIDSKQDWGKLRLTTAEAGAGFEFHVKISQNISWKNYIGVSVYYNLNYVQGMYHERSTNVLLLGTSVCIKHF